MSALLLAIIYLAFISLGLPDSLLGAGWPAMHEALSVPVSWMGIVSMVISAGTILASLLSDRLTRTFSTKIVTVVSVLLTAFALLGFSCSTEFWMLVIFSIPYGLGAGAIDAALNNYVALHYSSRSMSWLHCFWGVGTIISPLIMSYALAHGSWSTGYQTVGFIQLAIAAILAATLPLWRVHRNKAAESGPALGLITVLKIRGVPFILIGFFAYCAGEATTMYWASTYMVEVKGVGPETAALFGSLFYIGLTVGRFLGGFITDRLGDRRMIILGTVIIGCGLLGLLLPIANDGPTLAGFVIIGVGCAPIYPCIIHSTPATFGADRSGAIIGVQMASAYVGTMFMPPLYGVLGAQWGFGILPVYLIVWFGLMILMTELTFRVTASR